MQSVLPAVVLIIAAYLVGAIPVGYTLGRVVKGIDLRQYGTGNVGASNVYRNVGKSWGVLVAASDVFKGLWPWAAAYYLSQPETVAALAGLAAIVGYDWPVFTSFKGGRGLATSIGATAPLLPQTWFVLLAVLFIVGSAIKRVALLMVVAYAALPVFLWWQGKSTELVVIGAVVWLLLLVRRLDGVGEDLTGHESGVRLVLDRLLFDRRPGQRLTGPIKEWRASANAVGSKKPHGKGSESRVDGTSRDAGR